MSREGRKPRRKSALDAAELAELSDSHLPRGGQVNNHDRNGVGHEARPLSVVRRGGDTSKACATRGAVRRSRPGRYRSIALSSPPGDCTIGTGGLDNAG